MFIAVEADERYGGIVVSAYPTMFTDPKHICAKYACGQGTT